MNKKVWTAMSLLSLVTACSATLPAFALDMDSFLRTSLGSGSYQNTATQALIKSNISTRQAQLQQQISAGISSGQLTGPEEAELRLQLDLVSRLQSNYLADGVLNTSEVNNILSELGNVGTKLESYMSSTATTVSTFPGGMTLPPWSRPGGRDFVAQSTIRQANIDRLQLEVKTTIDTAAGNGRLTPREATSLRAQFDQISATELRFQADSRITSREESQLISDLNSLKSDVDRAIRNRRPGWGNGGWGHGNGNGGWGHGYGNGGWGYGNGNGGWGNGGWQNDVDIDTRQSVLSQRIQSGINSGRLSRIEGNRLLRDAQRIEDLEARLRISGGRLNFQERARLSMELDKLSRDLNKELFDRNIR